MTYIPKQGYCRSMTQAQWNEFVATVPRAERLHGKKLCAYILDCEQRLGWRNAPQEYLGMFVDDIPELKLYYRRLVEQDLASGISI